MKQAEKTVSAEIKKGIGKFLDSLRGERNASVHTVRAYQNELNRFAEYLGPEARWKEIDHLTIRGFLSHLHGSGLSKVSVARSLASLRSMYKWLAREGMVQQNPAKLVSTPKLPKKLPPRRIVNPKMRRQKLRRGGLLSLLRLPWHLPPRLLL